MVTLPNRYNGRFPKRKRKRVRLKVNVYLMNKGSGSEAWPNDHQYNLEPFTLTNGQQRYFRNLLFLLAELLLLVTIVWYSGTKFKISQNLHINFVY